MQRKGWTAVSAATATLALAGGYAVHHRTRPPVLPAAAVAVVSAPVTVVRPVATPSAPPARVRERPEGKLVETLATHDRRGGDVRMMAAVMTTQPPPPAAAAAPVEAAMTAAVARLPVFAAAAPVHVSCVRTACEVAGPLPAGQTEATMVTAFRDKQFEHDLLARGYTPGPVLVADAGDGSRGFVFYINNEF
jgi:hypothetical protein